tara:strand:- start:704 stop:865 length:162 start_codon:yes stop_codon:yes gene_type:complete
MDKSGLDDWVKSLTQPVDKKPTNPSAKICSSSVDQDIDQWRAKINKDQEKENA